MICASGAAADELVLLGRQDWAPGCKDGRVHPKWP